MKTFPRGFAAVVLTLALSVSSFSGETSFPGSIDPPPQNLTGETSFPGATLSTEIETSEVFPEVTALDPVTEGMLDVLQNLLLIF